MTQFKFTVYRDSWFRGDGGDDSRLRALYPDENGKACVKGCCLGHAAMDAGVHKDVIDNIPEFGEITEEDIKDFDLKNNEFLQALNKGQLRAMDINDNPEISDEQREVLLTQHFKDYNIEVDFVDGKRDWK